MNVGSEANKYDNQILVSAQSYCNGSPGYFHVLLKENSNKQEWKNFIRK